MATGLNSTSLDDLSEKFFEYHSIDMDADIYDLINDLSERFG
jgi:hypothetical protein